METCKKVPLIDFICDPHSKSERKRIKVQSGSQLLDGLTLKELIMLRIRVTNEFSARRSAAIVADKKCNWCNEEYKDCEFCDGTRLPGYNEACIELIEQGQMNRSDRY